MTVSQVPLTVLRYLTDIAPAGALLIVHNVWPYEGSFEKAVIRLQDEFVSRFE